MNRKLSPNEIEVADALALFLVENGADLGDERDVAQKLLDIPSECLPRTVAGRLFDAIVERARSMTQRRTYERFAQ